MVSFPRIPMQSCREQAEFCTLSVCFQISEFASRRRASREEKTEKTEFDRCDTQQLEGEAQDKSERVTSVSMVTKLVPANDEASVQRANREKTAA